EGHSLSLAKDPEPDMQTDGRVPTTPKRTVIGNSCGSPNSIDRIAPPVPLGPFATTPRRGIGEPQSGRSIDGNEDPTKYPTTPSTLLFVSGSYAIFRRFYHLLSSQYSFSAVQTKQAPRICGNRRLHSPGRVLRVPTSIRD